MEIKNLIIIVSLIVVVILAGGFVLLQSKKMAGVQEKNSQLILNAPEIEIAGPEKTEYPQYSNGSMPADCCAEDWQRIRLDKINAGGESRTCLFAHPRNNTIINLTYKNIKLKKTIRFATAIEDGSATMNNSPVYMDVYVDNVLLERVTQLDKTGWFATDVNTSKYENKLADVKFAISTDNDPYRHFCFDAEIVDQ